MSDTSVLEKLIVLENEIKHIKERVSESEESRSKHRERLYGVYAYKEKLDEAVLRIEHSQNNLETQTNQLRNVLFGLNGEEGLTLRLDRIEHAIKESGNRYHDFQKMFDAHANLDRWMFGTMITIMLAIFGKMVFF